MPSSQMVDSKHGKWNSDSTKRTTNKRKEVKINIWAKEYTPFLILKKKKKKDTRGHLGFEVVSDTAAGDDLNKKSDEV